jgi:hypothetical protein
MKCVGKVKDTDVGHTTRTLVGIIKGKGYLAHLVKRVISSRAVEVRGAKKDQNNLT